MYAKCVWGIDKLQYFFSGVCESSNKILVTKMCGRRLIRERIVGRRRITEKCGVVR